jgi:hypothetical protein
MVMRVATLSTGAWMLAMSPFSPPAASARPVAFVGFFFSNDAVVRDPTNRVLGAGR